LLVVAVVEGATPPLVTLAVAAVLVDIAHQYRGKTQAVEHLRKQFGLQLPQLHTPLLLGPVEPLESIHLMREQLVVIQFYFHLRQRVEVEAHPVLKTMELKMVATVVAVVVLATIQAPHIPAVLLDREQQTKDTTVVLQALLQQMAVAVVVAHQQLDKTVLATRPVMEGPGCLPQLLVLR